METATLLSRLQSTVNNPALFPEPSFDEAMYPDQEKALIDFRADCCSIFEALHKLAALCWDYSHYRLEMTSEGKFIIPPDQPDLDCLGVDKFSLRGHF